MFFIKAGRSKSSEKEGRGKGEGGREAIGKEARREEGKEWVDGVDGGKRGERKEERGTKLQRCRGAKAQRQKSKELIGLTGLMRV